MISVEDIISIDYSFEIEDIHSAPGTVLPEPSTNPVVTHSFRG